MGEEMASAQKFYIDGYKKGMEQGYLNALHDLEVKIYCVGVGVGNKSIQINQIEEILDKLKGKK